MLDKKIFDSIEEISWCPGCGNFSILDTLKETLAELDINPGETMMVSGIGQAAKTPQYIKANMFNGLHGRALPPAFGIKVANNDLKVIITSGDGDTYGEGGNHLLHNMRRNLDISHFVHDNQIYGLTKGQGSPTTMKGQKTSLQLSGVVLEPLNPITFAITNGATFVARSFSGDKAHLKEMMKAAILHKGYAIVDIMQNCISFNKVNTFKWYKERIYKLEDNYDKTNIREAFDRSLEFGDRIPIGIFYKVEMETYNERRNLKEGETLVNRKWEPKFSKGLLKEFK